MSRRGLYAQPEALLSRCTSAASLTVVSPLRLTKQPLDQSADVGDTVTFNVTATGTLPLAYEWRLSEMTLAGKTNANLVLTNVQFTNTGDYDLVVTNAYGSVTSQVATLRVAPAVFSKIATGPPVTDGGDSRGAAWGDYDNDDATNIDLVRIEWPSGILQELTNVAARQFLNVTETIPARITIWKQPLSRSLWTGANAALFLQASGPVPLFYQWHVNGAAISGATNRMLHLVNAQPAHAGGYTVAIRNSAGDVQATSETALVTVMDAPPPVPHHFTQITAQLDRSVQLGLSGDAPGANFDIFPLDASTNLTDWTALPALVSSNGSAEFSDPEATNLPQRFYRTPTNQLLTPFPKPTGPYAVGALDREFRDPARANKRIMTTFWYPAAPAPGALPGAYVDARLGLLESIRDFGISNNLYSLVFVNTGNTRFAGGRLDLNRIGAFGFSYGGVTSLEVGKLDARIKAAVNLDGTLISKAWTIICSTARHRRILKSTRS